MNIDAFVSVYFAHCSFLFCSGYRLKTRRKLGIDEKQTVKVEDDGMEIKDEESFEALGLGEGHLPRFVAPHPRGLAGFCNAFKNQCSFRPCKNSIHSLIFWFFEQVQNDLKKNRSCKYSPLCHLEFMWIASLVHSRTPHS